MTNLIENEGWRAADQAADLLSIDRDVCRRAFYGQPEEHVRQVVQRVLSERDLLEHDPEREIEGWARRRGAGVYSKDRRRGGLEHVEEIVGPKRIGARRGGAAY